MINMALLVSTTSIVLKEYAIFLGWALTAAIGFAFGVGIALKVFDILSTDIDEWEEIKKGNMGVALIFVSLIVMVGLLVITVGSPAN